MNTVKPIAIDERPSKRTSQVLTFDLPKSVFPNLEVRQVGTASVELVYDDTAAGFPILTEDAWKAIEGTLPPEAIERVFDTVLRKYRSAIVAEVIAR